MFKDFNATCESWLAATAALPADSPVKAEVLIDDDNNDDDECPKSVFSSNDFFCRCYKYAWFWPVITVGARSATQLPNIHYRSPEEGVRGHKYSYLISCFMLQPGDLLDTLRYYKSSKATLLYFHSSHATVLQNPLQITTTLSTQLRANHVTCM